MFYWRWFNRRHHPFARLVGGVLGLVLLVGVLTLGFFALVAFAFVGTIVALTPARMRRRRLLRHTRMCSRASTSCCRIAQVSSVSSPFSLHPKLALRAVCRGRPAQQR